MAKQVVCKTCGSHYHYQTFCPYKKRKPIQKRGKHAVKWEEFRDTVAKPYLDAKYGRICSKPGCDITTNLDVDHIKKRGSNPHLRYDVTNLRYLCRLHHIEETDRLHWSKNRKINDHAA